MQGAEALDLPIVQKVIDSINVPIRTCNWMGRKFAVRSLLSPQEMVDFAGEVIRMCTISDGEVFVPDLLDFSFKINVVLKYALVSVPDSFDDQYKLIYGTSLYKTVADAINADQLNSLDDTVKYYASKIPESNVHSPL